jgi:uncharacterized membrane-anchored protein
MKTKQLLIVFIVTALLQLAVPVKMIFDSEMTERYGSEYKFKTVPIDPTDPFRGKYITLNYDISSFPTTDTTYAGGEQIYLALKKDNEGFAQIASISHEAPPGDADYIIAEVSHNYGGNVNFEFLFNRFYMDEGKAAEAETSYAQYSTDTIIAKPAYALVAVKDGSAVVKNVIIDGIPIKDYVLKQRETAK